nr:hypothetical protein [Tanacetum cinerariifolium]
MESTIPLNEINSLIPPSIVITTSPLVLPIEDPEDSLIMGNKELNIIPEKESNEFIKSSVEDLVPIPKEKAVTFSNPLFNSNNDFISSDDESLSDEDVPKDNVKIIRTLFSNSMTSDDVELLLHHDLSIPKMSVASILEWFTYEPPLEENDDLFDLESKNDD